MKHAKYHFISRWHLDAPLEDTWEIICDTKSWPEWWKGVMAVQQLKQGDKDDVGAVHRYKWKSALPYTLTYDAELQEYVKYQRLKGTAEGELKGIGTWEFHTATKGTLITCTWEVETTQWWMNLLSFMLRPAFAYNHRLVMRWGAEGLAKKLGRELISAN